MPRFYFHLRGEEGVSRDTEGIDFESIDEAFLDAFRAATDLWRELLIARKDPRLHAFEITDAAGEVLIVLPFMEVLETARSGKYRGSTLRRFENVQATIKRSSAASDAIASEIRTAWNHLAEARVLLRSFESSSKVRQSRGSALTSH
jgi:hypothetical protein